jgi:hypothetical protein
MPTFSGRFEFCAGNGAAQQSGVCNLTLDVETLCLVGDKNPGFTIDLGDIDAIDAGDYELLLRVYDQSTLVLTQFGKAFKNLSHDLFEAWRNRCVQCLLLEDLEEVTRVEGVAELESAERTFSSEAEIRLYKSNLAILPARATALQWRLADIDTANFDESRYAIDLYSGKDRLTLTRLAKRSREFWGQLSENMKVLADKSTRVIHALFPFLSPGQSIETAARLKEGRMVSVSQLAAIHKSIPEALAQNAVSPQFKPYFNALAQRAASPGLYFAFKFIRKEEEAAEEEAAGQDASGIENSVGMELPGDSEATSLLPELADERLFCWFAFPLSSHAASSGEAPVAAWECTSQSGRATYLFRLSQPGEAVDIDAAIQRLNRGIVMVNFRREPIYLPDSTLEIQPRYRRYAIAQRNLSLLRNVRSQFIGRSIHTSLDAWRNQLESLIVKNR